ncbi:hypothetical protein [Chondromyces crocatus]|uniref:hypothetical protein n=1 Tax=Chondromyces crocatus TaxID=52 RepID=UPI00067B2889|nr:hypothetical protein [Chondromyces crocatus]
MAVPTLLCVFLEIRSLDGQEIRSSRKACDSLVCDPAGLVAGGETVEARLVAFCTGKRSRLSAADELANSLPTVEMALACHGSPSLVTLFTSGLGARR